MRRTNASLLPILILPLAAALTTSSCAPAVGDVVQARVAGSVAPAPVNGAVAAYAVGLRGERAQALGRTAVGDDGRFELLLGGHHGPLLLCASGDAFIDPSTGMSVAAGGHELCALVKALKLAEQREGVLLSPFSTLQAASAACLLRSGQRATLVEADLLASSLWNEHLAAGVTGFDASSTTPVLLGDGGAAVLGPEAWSGLLLAGLSRSARAIAEASGVDVGTSIHMLSLTSSLAKDASDERCVLDGRDAEGAALSVGAVALDADTLRGGRHGLAQGVLTFAAEQENEHGHDMPDLRELAERLATTDNALFSTGFTPDLDGPSMLIESPGEGAVSGTPELVVRIDDDSGVAAVDVIEPAALVGRGTLSCEDPTRCTFRATIPTALLPAGPITIRVLGRDAVDNVAYASVTVSVDNSVPQIDVSSPAGAGTGEPIPVSGLVRVLAQAADDDGLAAFSLQVGGSGSEGVDGGASDSSTDGTPETVQACAPPVLVNDCDQAPDPGLIDVLWETRARDDGPALLTFVAEDARGNKSSLEVPVVIDNGGPATVSGVVEVGAPVLGATVQLFAFDDGVRGALLAQTETDENGGYVLSELSGTGPVLVVATGGTFVDPATGLTLSLRPLQELAAALPSIPAGLETTANVNAWTTLASVRAVSAMNESPSFAAALAFNESLFAQHLSRPGALSLTHARSADLLVDVPAPSDAAAILALAHGGLSQMAAQVSIDAGGEPGQVTMIDLVEVLKRDAHDLVFDGKSDGTPLFLDGAFIEADSFVLRSLLAARVDNFVTNAPFYKGGQRVLEGVRNQASTITREALIGPGLFYDDLALDRSVLFPLDVPVMPFDQEPPDLSLAFAGLPDVQSGAALVGVVAMNGVAQDESGVAEFTVLAPEVTDVLFTVPDLRVELDESIAPNAAAAFLACDQQPELPPGAPVGESLERQVCVCAQARDTVGNGANRVLCFTRPRPVVTMSPTAFVGALDDVISVRTEGGFALSSCEARLVQNGQVRAISAGTVLGPSCDVELSLSGGLASGAARVETTVTEVGGAVTETSTPLFVDLETPRLELLSPNAGAMLQQAPQLSVRVRDRTAVQVTAEVTSNGASVAVGLQGTIVSGAVSDAAGAVVTFPAFVDAVADGVRTVRVTAVDKAGNESTLVASYNKDTTPPVLAELSAADGNPLSYVPLLARTPFVPSAACSVFPFAGCVFAPAPEVAAVVVSYRGPGAVPDTYRRWQHLTSVATNPVVNVPRVEGIAPTLRMRSEPSVLVEARIDGVCPGDADFTSRPRERLAASALGFVDVPMLDGAGMDGSMALSSETGTRTLCLSMRPIDAAGNKGQVVHHFFRYEATPAPLHYVWNTGPYDAAQYTGDVGAFDLGQDDRVLSGDGQGSAGRVFSHAYVVSPSSTYSARYEVSLQQAEAPRLVVAHAETVQISKVRAFNWCFTDPRTTDDLVNPDFLPVHVVGSAPDRPVWSGDSLGTRASRPSFTRFVPSGPELLGAYGSIEHSAPLSGDVDGTGSLSPQSSYETGSDTVVSAPTRDYGVALGAVSLEAWTFNQFTGLPVEQLSSGPSISFPAGGGMSSNARLILFRAPVRANAVTMRTAYVLSGQTSSLGFNDSCMARNSAGNLVNQISTLSASRFIVVDQDIGATASEPVEPRALLWVKDGSFAYCDGSSTRDCRYGRVFDDYRGATFRWQAGSALIPTAQVSGVPDARRHVQVQAGIPAGVVRTLSQEP